MSTVSDNYFDLPSRIEDAFAEIDSDIVMDLLNTDEDYAALSDRMDKLKTQHPVIDNMNEDSGEIRIPMPWPISKKSKRYKYDESGAERSVPLFCWQKCKASRKRYSV